MGADRNLVFLGLSGRQGREETRVVGVVGVVDEGVDQVRLRDGRVIREVGGDADKERRWPFAWSR